MFPHASMGNMQLWDTALYMIICFFDSSWKNNQGFYYLCFYFCMCFDLIRGTQSHDIFACFNSCWIRQWLSHKILHFCDWETWQTLHCCMINHDRTDMISWLNLGGAYYTGLLVVVHFTVPPQPVLTPKA